WICEERATKSGRKRPAALRVAPNLACGFVARRSQPHCRGMLPPRASPQAKLGATNVIGFMPQTTKSDPCRCGLTQPLMLPAAEQNYPTRGDRPLRCASDREPSPFTADRRAQ